MDLADEEIMARIIHKLYRRANRGESQTSFENLKKRFNQRDLGKKGMKHVDNWRADDKDWFAACQKNKVWP